MINFLKPGTKIIIALALISTICIHCNKNDEFTDKISFAKSPKFNKLFQLKKKITIQGIREDSLEITEVSKIIKIGDDTFLIFDIYTSSIFMINSNGIIKKCIATKGAGPGEFLAISDFCVDSSNAIYVLDYSGRKVGVFNNKGKFIKNYSLSFQHRGPQSISYIKNNDCFVICAQMNLTKHSSKENYSFLNYEDQSYLHIYDNNFRLKKSFFHPLDQLNKTKGRLSRQIEGPFVVTQIIGDKILAFSQEGFYRCNIFDINGKPDKIIQFKSSFFTLLDIRTTQGLKFDKTAKRWNFSNQKIGKIIASHSSPVALHRINDIFILRIIEPYENLYPQYREQIFYNFHYDIFSFDGSQLAPIATGVKSDLKIVGIDKKGIIYFSPRITLEDSNIVCFFKGEIKLED